MNYELLAACVLYGAILFRASSGFSERKYIRKGYVGQDLSEQTAVSGIFTAVPAKSGPLYSSRASSGLPSVAPATSYSATHSSLIIDESPTEDLNVTPAPMPSAPIVADTSRTKKKGFVAGVSDPTAAAKIVALNADWYYTWGATPPTPSPAGLPFTPMFWNLVKTKNPMGIIESFDIVNTQYNWDSNVLAYNEPDGTNASAQGNMTVRDAVNFWPNIAATGRRLGSPVMYGSLLEPGKSPNNTPAPMDITGPVVVDIGASSPVTLDPTIWLDNFLIQINQLKPRPKNPDFIAVHWYGPPNPSSFLNYLQGIYNKYKLPIWVTEYSCADWKATCCGGNPPGTLHTNVSGISWAALTDPAEYATNSTANFMYQTVMGMEAMPFVEKYSWKERFKLVPFTNPTGITGDSVEGPSNPDFMNQSALFESYVHFPTSLPPLTPLGTLYASL